ncbi:LOW QUALITY PROTEIN: dual specificity protein phosphatase 15 [Neopsephotus bourkii]|uniref:LOW QUALITY PROTEIN: dual specificity protein phosphatase 15 n=1 Tax=Neopsephotus bourkii TaxID=309878 RepID=UPI002AA50F3B|nr:LOW QUALITY PROTEIN: dual specificity protein phosphatase 15 [Neopsephotus bourkii]
MGNGMSQILPGLYLGNFIDAKDLEQLTRNKITHIVSIHESPQPLLQDITYLRIPLPDTPEANIKRHFKECITFIHQCRLHGGNCLVHCLAGISRSTTVVVAYVMAVTELSCQEVLEAIRTIRPVANPNPGFRQQLAEFGGGAARKVRRHLKQRYGASPFNDEEEIRALLPAGRGGPSRTEGALQGRVPRGRDIRSTTPFLLRVKRTFSCIPACLNPVCAPPPSGAGSVGRERESETRPRFRFLIPSTFPGRGAAMAAPGGPMRLKEWLIAQIDSGRYPGLRWENRHRTLFRIPWKHAAKQDYRQQQDAALFKAWAIYKGKYHEGTDKADPSTWKTRLRCALNKSTDFQEVPERSQLDISEPYKVYQIVSDSTWAAEKDGETQSPAKDQQDSTVGSPEEDAQKGSVEMCHVSPLPLLSAHQTEQGCHMRGAFYRWNPPHGHVLPRPPPFLPVEDINHSDSWLHVRLYYCDLLVKEVTTRTAEGCRITSRPAPADSERLYGPSCMEQIEFPPPRALGGSGRVAGMNGVLERLLPHLERGVLLWVAPEGVFMKRQCQGRVYWNGPLAPHRDGPNKLEREKTYKLLDTQQFLQQLRGYLSHGQPMPQYQIHLCFGEEFPTSAGQHFQKLIMAHIEPVFARELLHHAQRMGPMLLRDCPQPCARSPSSHTTHVLRQLCQP